MLQVSMGSLVSLVVIMLVCFVLPLAFFYVLYRAECRFRTMLTGAVAYLVCGVVADTVLIMGLDLIADVQTNAPLYLVYASLLSPALFVALNYFIIKRFGTSHMKRTGDSMMYALGYGSLCNIVSTGLVAIMYFLTLMDIRSRGGLLTVVSDADYVSATDSVSASDLVTESVYREMAALCGKPVSYYMGFVFNCLWILAVYAALFIVIWLAVKKKEKKLLLAFAFFVRFFATLPDILDHFKLVESRWLSVVLSVVILLLVWAAAIFCRRTFIDAEDVVKEETKNDKPEDPGFEE